MNSHTFLNPAVQTMAAFVIFVAGFVALFVLALASIGVVGFLYWAANRLAMLLAGAGKIGSMGRSMESAALPAPAPPASAGSGLPQAV